MNTFIELTNYQQSNAPLLVNLDHVIEVMPRQDRACTSLRLTGDVIVYVAHSYEDVRSMIDAAVMA